MEQPLLQQRDGEREQHDLEAPQLAEQLRDEE